MYNFGIEGATLQAETLLLKNFHPLYQLDQVIFYTGYNDAFITYLALFHGQLGQTRDFRIGEVG